MPNLRERDKVPLIIYCISVDNANTTSKLLFKKAEYKHPCWSKASDTSRTRPTVKHSAINCLGFYVHGLALFQLKVKLH